MCLLLTLHRQAPSERLVVAANRDERLDRPWDAPRLLVADPPVFGGRDRLAGGSWLAVNLEAGFVVGVTNARLGAPPGERSRGELVVDLASQRCLPDALALLTELELARYGPCNLLLADVLGAWVATNLPRARIERCAGRVAVLGNDPIDAQGPRVAFAAGRAGELEAQGGEDLQAELVALLADHAGPDPICRHGEGYGTVCSTMLVLGRDGVASYRFATGPPCTTPYHAVGLPARPTN